MRLKSLNKRVLKKTSAGACERVGSYWTFRTKYWLTRSVIR